ncbi:hypothetical protein AWB68_03196 [Caballeronia choica]|uniref:Uncharacterized protein n=1 Tax=Caballeronia choica TaxID=326476 RepID=A0A158IZG5_9BURK|nr:hypothetical protein AWB68_03196 [Caballeronia choica]
MMQAQKAPDTVADHDGHSDDDYDAGQQSQPGCVQCLGAERGAQQDHGNFEQGLGAETDSGLQVSGWLPETSHSRSDENGEDQCFQPGAPEQPLLSQLQPESDQSDSNAQGNAGRMGSHPGQRAGIDRAPFS